MRLSFRENQYDNSDDGTNFREIHMGAIAKGILYRSAYPVFLLDKERD
jgi:hypothetical protein